MGRIAADRIVRKLSEAEGYLMLDLPEKALEILRARSDWATMKFEASFLTGEALRALDRYREALAPLEAAARLRPGDLGVAIALGWCYKRTHRLAQAIDALERAVRENPDEALLHYNLACYWSLVGDPAKAIRSLSEAIDLDPEIRVRVANEADFDPIRHDAEFERLVAGKAPTA
jgi:tetratricopeptide (TPR) repeat protein